MRKFIFLIIIFFLFIPFKIFALEINDLYVNEEKDLSNYMINPLWEAYKNSGASNSDIIISKYIVKPQDSILNKYSWSYGAESNLIPDSYDMRNVDGVNYVTPVKDQNPLGLCWSFATISSLETYLVKHNMSNLTNNKVTFNERQLDYASVYGGKQTTALGTENFYPFSDATSNPYMFVTGENAVRSLGSGGSFETAGLALARGFSPVRQEGSSVWGSYWTGSKNNELQKSLSDVFDIGDVRYSVTGYTDFAMYYPGYNSETDLVAMRNRIKDHVMQYGSVYVSTLGPTPSIGTCLYNNNGEYVINWRGNFVNSSQYNSYCGISGNEFDYLHAMSIIGWDDDYHVSYCVSLDNTISKAPTGDSCGTGFNMVTVNGAWILKNSWGNTLPYLYLAYSSMAVQYGGITGVIQKNWDNNYDEVSTIKSYTVSGASTGNGYYKTFKKSDTGNEVLNRVSIITTNTTTATFYVDVDVDGSGNFTRFGSVTTQQPGMASVTRNDENFILCSSTYAIRVTGVYSKVETLYAFTTYSDNITNIVLDFSMTDMGEATISNENYIKKRINVSSRNIPTGTQIYYALRPGNKINEFQLAGMNRIINNALSLELYYKANEVPYGRYDFIMKNGSGTDATEYNLVAFEIKPELTFRSDIVSVGVGKSVELTYDYVNNSSETFNISYSSGNNSIATIDENGIITGVRRGNTYVEVKITVNSTVFTYPINVEVSDFGFVGYETSGTYLIIPVNLDRNTFETNIICNDGCEYSYQNVSSYIGTGTKLTITKHGESFKSYTIIAMGDLNGDGQVLLNDVTKLYRHFMGRSIINDEIYLKAGDVKRDGTILLNDVTKLYRYFMGRIPNLD
ncbi:MAG: Ig-like domain-containing protein [Bacilli bacterium]|nr:Ig-like domain-containing protein [Bacilli bacterium]